MLQHEKEAALVKHLGEFPATAHDAAKHYRPSSIAKYLMQLAQKFNEFYQQCVVISEKADEKHMTEARIMLVNCTRIVLRKGLELLGIDAPEKM